jgi:hypothetical protein
MALPYPIPLLQAPPVISPLLAAAHSQSQANPAFQAAAVQQGRIRPFSPPVLLSGERRDDTDPKGRGVCEADPLLLVDVRAVISY